MSRNGLILTMVAFLGIGRLEAQAPAAFPSWSVRETPSELRPIVSHADLIFVTMQDALLRELGRELARGGPESALRSCHVDTIGAIQRIGRSDGIEAGRTSDRVRNPLNAPRPWAAQLVRDNAGRQTRDVDGFVVDLGRKVGLLRPIRQQPMCAGCHGPSDRLTPAVRQALATRYAADRAVGFTEGEIRGWFWVEIPKSR